MGKGLNILSPWKVILLFPILFFFTLSQSYALDVTLLWDANTERDLAGYKIYYGTSTGDYNPAPADEADQGPSPITVQIGFLSNPNNPEYTLTGLTATKLYFLVVTAYDTEGLESGPSNEVTTGDSGGPGTDEAAGGGCFIATAAYGSNMDRHVKILTEFRDKRLVTNPIGHSIVDAYYKFSPPVANYLHKHPFARAVVRYALVPITSIAYISLSIHPLALLFAFALLLFTIVYIARHFLQSRINIS